MGTIYKMPTSSNEKRVEAVNLFFKMRANLMLFLPYFSYSLLTHTELPP